ncbi:F-box protein At-B-like [Bidens hawaiensis]|uniref:F-box protein At-B-like n=1 Tax=Bidens hawaiensis TaxID=980011 RepID=UPI00404B77B5
MEEKDNERAKRSVMPHNQTHAATTTSGDNLLERLPELILHEIFTMLEPNPLPTLCSLACVSRTLKSSVNKTLASFSSIDLSVISSLDSETFDGVIRKFGRGRIKNITLDCLRLNDASIVNILGPDIQELILLKCSSVLYKFIASIGNFCPNLRILTLEFSGFNRKPEVFDLNFQGSFVKCQRLESLKIKIRGGEVNDYAFMLLGIYQELPETVKIFKLQPASALDTILFLKTSTPLTFGQALTHISLVIDVGF